MFKGRVERVSHEGGLLVTYSGACPALGSVMIDSGETYIGKVDGVIGNLKESLVHIAHLDRKADAQAMVGLEITIRTRKSRDKQHSNDGGRDRENRGNRDDRRGNRDDNRGERRSRDNRSDNSNHQKQDWDCPKCNNSNFSFRTECNRCGESKGRGDSNYRRDDRRGRDHRRGGDDRRDNRNTHGDNDWDCPKCNNSNFAFRTECNRCGESKGRGGSNFQRNDRGGNDRRGRDDRRGGNDRRGRDSGRGDNGRRGRDDRRGGNDRRDNRDTHGDNDWECRECKNSNFSFRNECNRCGAPKRKDGPPSKKWEGNDRRAGDRTESTQPRAGDWECPQCGKSNFAKRNDCFGCGRSKRVGGPRNKGHHRKLRDPPALQSAKYGRGERRNR